MSARHAEALLTVAGTGSQEGRLRELATAWKLDVNFVGHVQHDDLPALYNDHDIFINASRVDNFPGALVEASASGLAIVSTSPGGIPFMYRHEKDALLVEPGDWQGLADAAERLLASDALARLLISNSLAVARACEWTAVRREVYASYAVDCGDRVAPGVEACAPEDNIRV